MVRPELFGQGALDGLNEGLQLVGSINGHGHASFFDTVPVAARAYGRTPSGWF